MSTTAPTTLRTSTRTPGAKKAATKGKAVNRAAALAPAEPSTAPSAAQEGAAANATAMKKTAARKKAVSPRSSRRPAAAAQPTATAPKPASGESDAALVDRLTQAAAAHTLAISPLTGIRVQDLGDALQTFMGAVTRQPFKAAWFWGGYALELGKVLAGRSTLEPDPQDKRFADATWRSSRLHKGLVQHHTALAKTIRAFVDATDLSPRDKARAHLVAAMYVDAVAPSNALIHPAAMRRALETRGRSLVKGFQNLVQDMRHNRGLPASVDKSKFKVGGNLAKSPGKVVFKTEVLELIQYTPTTATVYQRPLVVCPPQVNKFYALDLSAEKSLVKFAVDHGLQVFAVSWRNPGAPQRDWNLSTYVKALDEAVDAAREITGSAQASLWGACSGGITAAAYLGWLAATGQDKVANVISPVCTLDPENAMDTTMGLFVTPESVAAIKAAVKRKGYVDGADMARVFAWLRPNDLIWNYWVNNYLLGADPPAFDVLFWNADTTRLPAAFHADILDVMQSSPFTQPGGLKVLGQPVDMRQVGVDAYIVAGITDHITPWKSCYPTARIYGPDSTFVLANAGHLQSLLNPPGAPKSFFMSGRAQADTPDGWMTHATRTEGSWWPHWMAWMHARSGPQVQAPASPGSAAHAPGADAPGEYVHRA